MTQVIATLTNRGRREIAGTDLALSYDLPDSNQGKFVFALNASLIHKFLEQVNPIYPESNLAGQFSDLTFEGNGALPKTKANLGFSWNKNNLGFHYTMQYISELHEYIASKNTEHIINSWATHDIQLNYLVQNQHLKYTVGLDNLLNTSPPFIATAFNDNYDGRNYDIAGRFFYLRLTLRF